MAKILIIDDDEGVRKVMAERFKERYDVVSAKNEKEAIEIIEKYPPFDLVVTDLRMIKKEGGINVLEVAKKKDLLTEVIIITAYGSLGNVHRAMEFGIWTYIDKAMENAWDILDMDVKRALEHKQKVESEYPESVEKAKMRATEDLIYEKYRDELEKKHQKGEFVAIGFDNEEIIVDKDDTKVLEESIKKFGKGKFLFKRIGYDYVYAVGVGGGDYDN